MTINRNTMFAVGRMFIFSVAICLTLCGLACDSIGGQRSCDAITADIASNLSGAGIAPSQAVICRGLELTLEAFDAG